MTTYNYYYDAGHGWIKVEYQELQRLNILDKISVYSYISLDNVYLEEDRDATIFIEAKKEAKEPYLLNEIDEGNRSSIRLLEHFNYNALTVA